MTTDTPGHAFGNSSSAAVTVHIEPVLSKIMASLEFSRLMDGSEGFSGKLPMVAENGLCIALTGTGPKGEQNAHRIANALNLLEQPGIGPAVRGLLNVIAEHASAQPPEAPRPLIEQGRYQLICANGCGRCGIKLSEFEYERTETEAGELVSRKTIPQIVSACCGHEVEVWDEVAQENMPHKIMAVTVDQLYSHSGPAPYSGDWIAARDINRLVRELDVALNGEAGAARQASLVDIVAQVKRVPAGYELVPVEPKQKMAPVQGYPAGIPWAIHLEAYAVYCKKWSPQPALIDLEGRGCRGGFCTSELDEFIPGWRDRVSEFGKLQAEVKQLRARLAATVQQGGAA